MMGQLSENDVKIHLRRTISTRLDARTATGGELPTMLEDIETLKQFLYCAPGHDIGRATGNLWKIVNHDPGVSTDPFLRKVAVATAWAFTVDLKYFASGEPIKILDRYDQIKKHRKNFFKEVFEMSPWHLMYLACGWHTDEEWTWAQANIPPELKNIESAYEATHKMVKYKSENYKGISVHAGAEYYDYKPPTMDVLYHYGGVCGAVSKFGVGMCNAHGQPAIPVGQPGHCAFIYYDGNEWQMSNGVSTWSETYIHDGCLGVWPNITNQMWPMHLMNYCQQYFDAYVRSNILFEKALHMKEPRLFKEALMECKYNLKVWYHLFQQDSAIIWKVLCAAGREIYLEMPLDVRVDKPKLVSQGCKVHTTDRAEEARNKNLTDGTDSEWWSQMDVVTITLDLGRSCVISGLEIKWWGISCSGSYSVDLDGEALCDNTSAYQTPEGYNSWSKFRLNHYKSGRQLRLLLREGQLDPWGQGRLFGIRQLNIHGWPIHDIKPINGATIDNVEMGYTKMVKISFPGVFYISKLTLALDVYQMEQLEVFGEDMTKISAPKVYEDNGVTYVTIERIIAFFTIYVSMPTTQQITLKSVKGFEYPGERIAKSLIDECFDPFEPKFAEVREFLYGFLPCIGDPPEMLASNKLSRGNFLRKSETNKSSRSCRSNKSKVSWRSVKSPKSRRRSNSSAKSTDDDLVSNLVHKAKILFKKKLKGREHRNG